MYERGELFEGVRQWPIELAGVQGKLPAFYYENATFNLMYTASSKAVRALLPDDELRLIELQPGRCVVVFTAFEYKNCDVGPYNEVAISFPVTRGRRPLPGLSVLRQALTQRYSVYVWQLPVTTEAARLGGIEYFGYPKFLADIAFRDEGDARTCTLEVEGCRILALEGKRLPVKQGPLVRIHTYSYKDSVPLRTAILTNNLLFAQRLRTDAARVVLGDAHPIADALRGLALSPRPLVYQYAPLNEAILFAGRNLVEC